MATLFVDKVDPQSGTSLEIGSSGDTITIPSGATITNSGTATGFGGITMADSWRITSNYTISSTGNSDLTSNWERTDSGGFGQIGTGLSESSGIFTFPSTGIYYIHAQAQFESGASLAYIGIRIQTTTNNSSYGNSSQNYNTTSTTGSNVGAGCAFIIDVTDTSTHKFKINIETAASVNVQGATDQLRTGFNVFRLGDT